MTSKQKLHEAAVDAVLAKLKTFMMSPDHGDGSWPDIPQAELDTAGELVREMLDLKWGQDVDGDAPVRVRMWSRRDLVPVCDWAYIQQGPRDQSQETADELHARLLRNLSSANAAMSSCAEAIKRVHVEMADIHSRKLRKDAAFEVHFVRFTATPEWDAGEHGKYEPASLHMTQDDAEQFIASQAKVGLKMRIHVTRMAMPTSRDRETDSFADYRRKVQEHCGKLLPDFKLVTDLNLQHGRMVRKSAAA